MADLNTRLGYLEALTEDSDRARQKAEDFQKKAEDARAEYAVLQKEISEVLADYDTGEKK